MSRAAWNVHSFGDIDFMSIRKIHMCVEVLSGKEGKGSLLCGRTCDLIIVNIHGGIIYFKLLVEHRSDG